MIGSDAGADSTLGDGQVGGVQAVIDGNPQDPGQAGRPTRLWSKAAGAVEESADGQDFIEDG